ncbi:MAG: hypothetical protein ACI32N_00695 [Bulleidia sp.]
MKYNGKENRRKREDGCLKRMKYADRKPKIYACRMDECACVELNRQTAGMYPLFERLGRLCAGINLDVKLRVFEAGDLHYCCYDVHLNVRNDDPGRLMDEVEKVIAFEQLVKECGTGKWPDPKEWERQKKEECVSYLLERIPILPMRVSVMNVGESALDDENMKMEMDYARCVLKLNLEKFLEMTVRDPFTMDSRQFENAAACDPLSMCIRYQDDCHTLRRLLKMYPVEKQEEALAELEKVTGKDRRAWLK